MSLGALRAAQEDHFVAAARSGVLNRLMDDAPAIRYSIMLSLHSRVRIEAHRAQIIVGRIYARTDFLGLGLDAGYLREGV